MDVYQTGPVQDSALNCFVSLRQKTPCAWCDAPFYRSFPKLSHSSYILRQGERTQWLRKRLFILVNDFISVSFSITVSFVLVFQIFWHYFISVYEIVFSSIVFVLVLVVVYRPNISVSLCSHTCVRTLQNVLMKCLWSRLTCLCSLPEEAAAGEEAEVWKS